MNILIIGLGGVGAMAAYALELNDNVAVTAVIRSDYDIVTEKGFRIESVDYGVVECFRPSKIVKSIEAGNYDYVVVCTKNIPEVTRVEELIAPAVGAGTAIVLLQNGINIEKAVLEKFPQNVVLSGVSMISSLNYGAQISHVGKDVLQVGYFPNGNLSSGVQEQSARTFVELYHNGKNECTYDGNVKFTRWRKLVYNATLNPICALTNVDVGRLDMFGGVESMVRPAMREVLAIARADGIELPEEIMEAMIRSDDGVYYAPSMLVDVRKGNYVEVEVICGNPVRIAQKYGVSVPTLSLIYNLLTVVQQRTMEANGRIEIPKVRPMP